MTTRKEMLQAAIDSNRLEIIHIDKNEVHQADTLAKLSSVTIDAYSDAGAARKQKYHRRAARQLKTLAKVLGLTTPEYDLRSNKGGIAVCGEITLHTDKLYVQVSQSCFGVGNEIMFRTCDGRKDYGSSRSGHNHFTSASRLDNVEDFAAGLRRAGVI